MLVGICNPVTPHPRRVSHRNVAQHSRANHIGQKVGVMQVRSVPVCGGPWKRESPDLYFWSSAKFYETGEDEFGILTHYLERFG